MEEEHRELIRENYVLLVKDVNIYELLPCLIQKGVFTLDQAETYRDRNISEKERKRSLFLDIQRRGPRAYYDLIDSLLKLDETHQRLAYKLQNKQYENNNNNKLHNEDLKDSSNNFKSEKKTKPFILPENKRPAHIRQLSEEAPYLTDINLSTEPLVVKVKKSLSFFDDATKSKVPIYRMRSRNRGLFLCVNNIEFLNNVVDKRLGAEVDEENLKDLFKQMGFTTESHRNLSFRDMKKTIDNFTNEKKNTRLHGVDCVVVAVMSHGEEGETKESSQIITSDSHKLSVSWILEQFNNINCPALINKPKIFIFQICRGDNLHVGVRTTQSYVQSRVQSDGIQHSGIVRSTEDMLIAYSTLPGDKSYRDIYLGTWYMQAVCKIFMEHAHDTDMENLLKMVDAQLKHLRSADGNMQTSSYENRGFKLCYLHPGLHQEEKLDI